MPQSKTHQSVWHLPLKRRQPKREKTVHELLSKLQAAYAVFVPKREQFFKLFDIIFLNHDRPNSPRNANSNLCEIFERIYLQDDHETGWDKRIMEAFLKQFEKVSHLDIIRDPWKYTVSEESLRRAGFEITTAGPRAGSNASKMRDVYRQLRLSWLRSDVYTGYKQLQNLIWEHAEAVFLLILKEIGGEEFSTKIGDRSLMGIVTERLINKVGVSGVVRTVASGNAGFDSGVVPGGAGASLGMENVNAFREEYDAMTGVSGLHFILFRVEQLDKNQWRFYKGIDVCDSELGEDASTDALRRDGLYRAGRWLRGADSADNGTASDYRDVTNVDSTRSRINTMDATSDGLRKANDLDYVDVRNEFQTVAFVDIDITPILSEFASEQCTLAAYYRKVFRNNTEKTAHAVSILRSALRKCCFESMIRALYDLSGCYLDGIGVQVDNNIGRLLRYCARGMRRNYVSRRWWLKRLVLEIGFRQDDAPERSIGTMALLCRWRLVRSDAEATYNYAMFQERRTTGVTCDAVSAKKLYEDAIKEGRNVPAMYNLAVLLEKGAKGVRVDAVRAKELYEEAIKEGRLVHAMTKLAYLLQYGAERVCVDAVRAKELYEDAIREGRLVPAMNNLAMLLQNGAEGVRVDAVRAKELYEDAIREGRLVPAMNNLAMLLQKGADGVHVDAVRAKELYEYAIMDGNDINTMNNLALLLQNGAEGVHVDAVRAKQLYKYAIMEKRNVTTMYNFATLLQNGAEGVRVDAIWAKELYEDVIRESRDIPAMYNLATLLQNGAEGVHVDAVRAKELYEDVIREARDVPAMNNLAMLLQNGAEGVRVDAVRAKELYEDAIREGRFVPAMNNLALLLQNGAEGVRVDAVRAKELYEDAIREGRLVPAMNNLAMLLQKGADGVHVDAVRAKELYEYAIMDGNDVNAMNNLALLLQNGAKGVHVDAVRAKQLYKYAIMEKRKCTMYNLVPLLPILEPPLAVTQIESQHSEMEKREFGEETELIESLQPMETRGKRSRKKAKLDEEPDLPNIFFSPF